jgi:hypothetical protein
MSRFFARLASIVAAFSMVIAMPHQAEAWHCHRIGWGAPPIWGSYGMGGGFRHVGFGCHRGFFPSAGFFPAHGCFSTSIGFRPATCLSFGPRFYSCGPSFFCPPVITCYPPVQTSFFCPPVVYRSVSVPFFVQTRPSVTPAIILASRTSALGVQPSTVRSATVRSDTALTNASWLASAVELIDLMVEKGGVEEGLQACEQLIRVRENLPSEVWWRAAVLAAVSDREPREVAALIETAEKADGQFSARQLPGGSLRAYLRTANASTLDDTLNRFAKAALTNPNPTPQYRVLSAMLALDGQSERSRLFLAAATRTQSSADTTSITSLAALDR